MKQVILNLLIGSVSSNNELFRQFGSIERENHLRVLQGCRDLALLIFLKWEPEQVPYLQLVIVVIRIAVNQATGNVEICVTILAYANHLLVVTPVQ